MGTWRPFHGLHLDLEASMRHPKLCEVSVDRSTQLLRRRSTATTEILGEVVDLSERLLGANLQVVSASFLRFDLGDPLPCLLGVLHDVGELSSVLAVQLSEQMASLLQLAEPLGIRIDRFPEGAKVRGELRELCIN